MAIRFLKQKSPDSQGEGATKRLCSSHFSQADDAGLELAPDIENKFNRLPWCHRASPSTTRHESVKSTDADKLMQKDKSVKGFFVAQAFLTAGSETFQFPWRLESRLNPHVGKRALHGFIPKPVDGT